MVGDVFRSPSSRRPKRRLLRANGGGISFIKDFLPLTLRRPRFGGRLEGFFVCLINFSTAVDHSLGRTAGLVYLIHMDPIGGALPDLHAGFLDRALERLKSDDRIVGVALGGSYLTRSMDEFSDLDLVVACEPDAYADVLAQRQEIAAGLGPLLAAFTGEHVGEPRLLICLYGPPLLHVDFKFVSLADVSVRVEDPEILWERDGRLAAVLGAGEARFPAPDAQWIEDRFWIWLHYGATKVGRGELFEAIDFLGFLRGQVLGPLALVARGARPTGVRKLETSTPELAARMRRTLASYDRRSCLSALREAAQIYRDLRATLDGAALRVNREAEAAAMTYLAEMAARFGAS